MESVRITKVIPEEDGTFTIELNDGETIITNAKFVETVEQQVESCESIQVQMKDNPKWKEVASTYIENVRRILQERNNISR